MKIFLVSLIVGLHHILNTYQGGVNQREILVLLQLHITLFSTWDICQCNNTSHVSCREGLSPFSAGPDVHSSMFQLLTLNGLMSGHCYLDIWVSTYLYFSVCLHIAKWLLFYPLSPHVVCIHRGWGRDSLLSDILLTEAFTAALLSMFQTLAYLLITGTTHMDARDWTFVITQASQIALIFISYFS